MMARRTALRPLLQIGALLGAIMVATPAQAEVRIAGTIDSGNLTIEAHNATVREILDALAARQSIEFRSSEALSRPITGTYSGTPRRVISRILEGYDHVVQSTQAGIRVTIFGAVGAAKAVAAAAPAPVGPKVGSSAKVSSSVDPDGELAAAAANNSAVTPSTASVTQSSAPAAARSDVDPDGELAAAAANAAKTAALESLAPQDGTLR